jgi:Ankyrin repeats (many copies)
MHTSGSLHVPGVKDGRVVAAARCPHYQCCQADGLNLAAALCSPGSQEVVELLLAAGADPNLPVEGGATALHAAAATGSLSTVLALLQVSLVSIAALCSCTVCDPIDSGIMSCIYM